MCSGRDSLSAQTKMNLSSSFDNFWSAVSLGCEPAAVYFVSMVIPVYGTHPLPYTQREHWGGKKEKNTIQVNVMLLFCCFLFCRHNTHPGMWQYLSPLCFHPFWRQAFHGVRVCVAKSPFPSQPNSHHNGPILILILFIILIIIIACYY